MSPKVNDMIRAQLDEAVTELEFARQRIQELEQALDQSRAEIEQMQDEAEVNKEQNDALDPQALGFSGDESFLAAAGGEYSATTLYLLPSNVPSSGMGGDGWRRGVIDRAGALTYDGFAPTSSTSATGDDGAVVESDDDGSMTAEPLYRPMGWTVDIYMTDAMGVEHMACRDRNGRRNIAWTLERGKLVCPWTRTVITTLPLGRWVRITAQIHWADKYVTWLIDGKVAVQRHAFRDAQSGSICSLDLYPRSSLVACYANMRFFK